MTPLDSREFRPAWRRVQLPNRTSCWYLEHQGLLSFPIVEAVVHFLALVEAVCAQEGQQIRSRCGSDDDFIVCPLALLIFRHLAGWLDRLLQCPVRIRLHIRRAPGASVHATSGVPLVVAMTAMAMSPLMGACLWLCYSY